MANCPCCSKVDYDKCCGPLISGERKASSPEELMRSRYSAYVEKNIEYIIETHHPNSGENLDRESIEAWSNGATWLGLEIIPRSEEDKVEFIARFKMDDAPESHHELSTFKKHNGDWYFYDGKVVGDPIIRAQSKVGRNDPCSCGSGKKYKKCCL